MTVDALYALFELDETPEGNEVPQLSENPQLHVFLLLDQLLPGQSSVVAAVQHDQIFLSAPLDRLAPVISRDQVIDLMQHGVFIDEDSLAMFVQSFGMCGALSHEGLT